jgi:hypothetical protein
MTTPRALTQNASSGKQVRRAGKKEKQAERRVAAFVNAVMASYEGREFVWWLLGDDVCRTTASVMRDGPERVQYYSGKQDIGHLVQIAVITTNQDAYLLMQREAMERNAAEQAAAPAEEPGMVSEKPDTNEDDDG